MKNLIQGFLGYLPEGFEVEFTGSDHDLGSQVLGQDQRERAMELAVKGEREFGPVLRSETRLRLNEPRSMQTSARTN